MSNYHQIRTDDMLNGDGLRVVLFLSGCNHHCENCHNIETWDECSGYPLTSEACADIIAELKKDYISGITFSGGDPLHPNNVDLVNSLIAYIRTHFPDKTIWLYTGYTLEDIYRFADDSCSETMKRLNIVMSVDVLVDGKFEQALADVNYPWAGSTNQRIIDIPNSLKAQQIILYKS